MTMQTHEPPRSVLRGIGVLSRGPPLRNSPAVPFVPPTDIWQLRSTRQDFARFLLPFSISFRSRSMTTVSTILWKFAMAPTQVRLYSVGFAGTRSRPGWRQPTIRCTFASCRTVRCKSKASLGTSKKVSRTALAREMRERTRTEIRCKKIMKGGEVDLEKEEFHALVFCDVHDI